MTVESLTKKTTNKLLFEATFLKHQCEIRRYVASLLPNRADADDVFQRVSLVLWEKYATYDSSRSFSAWAYGVAFYEVKNFVRVRSRSKLHFNDELLTILAYESEQRSDDRDRRISAMQECLQEMKTADRKLLEQSYGNRSSIKELAAQMGRSSNAIYKRLDRLRAKLQTCIRIRTSREEKF